MPRSAALTSDTHRELATHLLGRAPEEDLCFGVWRPSTGAARSTALVHEVVLPLEGERHVHGNASFEGTYFRRAAQAAADADGGLAFFHSHPAGRGWQGMSSPDVETESRHAKRAMALTGKPLVGLTMAGDTALSARFWERTGRNEYERRPCSNVRVVGDQLKVTWDDALVPPPTTTARQIRTVAAWSDGVQQNWSRLRIGVVGAGTVGANVAESLVRMGATNLVLIDHDTVEELNLDRLLNASLRDALLHRAKVEALARGLRRSASAAAVRIEPLAYSVVERRGLECALDCDVIFSCVDRPWPRAALNYLAYAHLVPVVDVGIRVSKTPRGRMRNAYWRSQVAAPGRSCLACLGQYQPADVTAERDGSLDDPEYIARLPEEHPYRARQNVFAFAAGAASMAVNQFLSMTVSPSGVADVGVLEYQLNLGRLDQDQDVTCSPYCEFRPVVAEGDAAEPAFRYAGHHPAAERTRSARADAARRLHVRVGRRVDELLDRAASRLDRFLIRGAARHAQR